MPSWENIDKVATLALIVIMVGAFAMAVITGH